MKGYRIGSRKISPQPPQETGHDRKVIPIHWSNSGPSLIAFLLLVAGRKGIVKPSSKSRVYLPDVTGLTNALESPARVRLDYHRVNPADREIQSQFSSAIVVHVLMIWSPRTHREYLEHCAIKIGLPGV